MILSQLIWKWEHFEKSCQENFFNCRMKIAIFWKMLKTTQLWPTTVTKPLNQNWILRYQWKDHIHIFHLVPCAWNSVHWICLSDHVKIVAPEGKRAKLSDTSISSSLSLDRAMTIWPLCFSGGWMTRVLQEEEELKKRLVMTAGWEGEGGAGPRVR